MRKAKFYYKDKNAPTPNKPNHIGACCIIIHNDKILMEYRSDSDYWALIGGGLKIHESLQDGATREIFEETGLVIKEDDLQFFDIFSDPSRIIEYPDGNIFRCITVAYVVNIDFSHDLKVSSESRELRYFAISEISKLNAAATHKHIVEQYIDSLIK